MSRAIKRRVGSHPGTSLNHGQPSHSLILLRQVHCARITCKLHEISLSYNAATPVDMDCSTRPLPVNAGLTYAILHWQDINIVSVKRRHFVACLKSARGDDPSKLLRKSVGDLSALSYLARVHEKCIRLAR